MVHKLFKLARAIRVIVRTILSSNMATKSALFGALGLALWLFVGLSLLKSFLLVVFVYLATGGYRMAIIFSKTYKRDIR